MFRRLVICISPSHNTMFTPRFAIPAGRPKSADSLVSFRCSTLLGRRMAMQWSYAGWTQDFTKTIGENRAEWILQPTIYCREDYAGGEALPSLPKSPARNAGKAEQRYASYGRRRSC
jgi:hypothetical protein